MAQEYLVQRSIDNNFRVEPKDLAEYANTLREGKFDSHIVFDGPNGVGKSTAVHMTSKHMGGMELDNVVFPFMTHADFIDIITGGWDQNIWIDELGHFFPYKQSMSVEQTALFSAIEVARSHRNCFMSCCRDITRINNNYRNGKAAVVVKLLDREDKPASVEGVVLLGNPFMEMEDKFFLSQLAPTYSYEVMRRQLEALPSFIGYIFFGDSSKVLDKKLIAAYEKKKEEGIQYVRQYQHGRIDRKQLSFNTGQASLGDFQE